MELFNVLITKGSYKSSTYSENEIINNKERASNKLYFIKEGAVKISLLTEKGEEIIPVLLNKSQIFGVNALFGDRYSSFTSESINNNTTIYMFDINTIYEMVTEDSNLQNDLLHILKEEYNEIENRIRVLIIRSAYQRLVQVLIELKDKFGYQCPYTNNVIINSPFNQDDLANYMRISRVTANNIINKLKEKSLLQYRKKQIILTKRFLTNHKPCFRA